MSKKRGVFDAPTPNRQKTETDIREEIKSALGRIDGVWIHVNTIFEGETKRRGYVSCGLGVGSPDIVGAVRCGGLARFFSLELKSEARHVHESDALSEDQKTWHAMMRGIGGFVGVVWSAEEAVAAVERCRAGAVE